MSSITVIYDKTDYYTRYPHQQQVNVNKIYKNTFRERCFNTTQ